MLVNLLDGTTENSNGIGTWIILIVIVVVLVGFMIWQNVQSKKKAKEAEEAIGKLKKGDKIKTIGGICGYLVEMDEAENTFVLETGTDGNKSYVKFDKQAIYQTASMGGDEPAVVEAPVEETVKEEVAEVVTEEAPVQVEEKPKKKSTAKKATSKKATTKKAEEPKEEKPE